MGCSGSVMLRREDENDQLLEKDRREREQELNMIRSRRAARITEIERHLTAEGAEAREIKVLLA